MMNAQLLKVVHVATYVNGGAGTAAFRIHQALLSAGVHSSFLCTDEPVSKDAVNVYSIQAPQPGVIIRMFRKVRRVLSKFLPDRFFGTRFLFEERLRIILPKMKYEVTSIPYSYYRLQDHPLIKEADIVHLHWISGFVDYPRFFSNVSAPVFFTLHDLNPIRGLFHYDADEIRNSNISKQLNLDVFECKRKAILESRVPVIPAAPSLWMKQELDKSTMFAPGNALHIPYALDPGVFSPKETASLRMQLGIPVSNTVLLYISQSIHNYRKGFDMLKEALAGLDQQNITLLAIGYSGDKQPGNNAIVELGIVNDNDALAGYYSLADAFILPSREDNLPNVMLEALCCGTPVICFSTGGMAAEIVDGFNGIKAPVISALVLRESIEKFINTKMNFNPAEIRKAALEKYSPALVAKKYIEAYRDTLRKS